MNVFVDKIRILNSNQLEEIMLIMSSRSIILFAELFVNTHTKYGFLLHTNQYKTLIVNMGIFDCGLKYDGHILPELKLHECSL